MNPILVAELLSKNGSDIEAIVATIGLPTLLRLAPHFMAIATTATELMAKQKQQ